MSRPSISFIVPTKGRPELGNLIAQLREEIGADDEVIVVGDGIQLPARGIMSFGDWRFHYFETSPTGHWGNEQRQSGMKWATRDFLFFADDDDGLIEGAIANLVRPALAIEPELPHIWRLGHEGTEPARQGMIDARGCFVPPNDESRLGRWSPPGPRGQHCQGWVFIRDTMAYYTRPIYHQEEIYVIRPDVARGADHQLYYRNQRPTDPARPVCNAQAGDRPAG
jgi:glycosyltransferase involved in cell wall biosynthesis